MADERPRQQATPSKNRLEGDIRAMARKIWDATPAWERTDPDRSNWFEQVLTYDEYTFDDFYRDIFTGSAEGDQSLSSLAASQITDVVSPEDVETPDPGLNDVDILQLLTFASDASVRQYMRDTISNRPQSLKPDRHVNAGLEAMQRDYLQVSGGGFQGYETDRIVGPVYASEEAIEGQEHIKSLWDALSDEDRATARKIERMGEGGFFGDGTEYWSAKTGELVRINPGIRAYLEAAGGVPYTSDQNAQDREEAGRLLLEQLDEDGLIDGKPPTDAEQELMDAFNDSEAAQAGLGQATLEQYGLLPGDVPDFLRELADHARRNQLGDLETSEIIDRLSLGDHEIAAIASDLARGNTFDKMFIKTRDGGEFGMSGVEYRNALAVSGVNAQVLGLTIAAADDQGFAADGGWQNLLLLVKNNGLLFKRSYSEAPFIPNQQHIYGRSLRPGGPASGTGGALRSGVDQIAKEYQQKLMRFNGVHSLAMIALAGREDLAREAYENGGLTGPGRADVADLLSKWDRFEDLNRLGINTGDKFWTQLTTGSDRGVGAGGGVSELPNTDATRESYRTIYRSMFLEDPTEGDLADFASTVTNKYMEVDAESRTGYNVFKGGVEKDRELRETLAEPAALARDRVRSNPLYHQLYGKRGSLTEDQYRSGFQNAVLGTGADVNTHTDAVLAGLRTGQQHTAEGRVLFSEEAGQAKTLQEKLARAALVIARNT